MKTSKVNLLYKNSCRINNVFLGRMLIAETNVFTIIWECQHATDDHLVEE